MAVQLPRLPALQPRLPVLSNPEEVPLVLVLLSIKLVGFTPINVLIGAVPTAWFLVRIGLIYYSKRFLQRGCYRQALTLAQIACWLNPCSVDSRWLSGISALSLREPLLAVKHLRWACWLATDNVFPHAALSAALIEAGRPQEALIAARRAIALDPKNYATDAGQAVVDEGGYQVERLLRASLSNTLHPLERATTYCALASHLIKQGRQRDAVACLAQATRLLRACPLSIQGRLRARINQLLAQAGEPELTREQPQPSARVNLSRPDAAEDRPAATIVFSAIQPIAEMADSAEGGSAEVMEYPESGSGAQEEVTDGERQISKAA